MPEPLKNLYSVPLLEALCREIKYSFTAFNAGEFMSLVLDEQWESRELKQRMNHVSKALHICLPQDYCEAIEILKRTSPAFTGFEYMFFPGFVELYGIDHYDVSIAALEHFTENASSEFAVRPFIKQYEAKTMAQMNRWAESNNYHVRRLASEGCRPRLPWAMALPAFKRDPRLILPILKKLKADESEYVRRSVANNLNDIAKDNPLTVVSIAQRWLGDNEQTDRLLKHACRTLLKQAQSDIMKLFGLAKPEHIQIGDLDVQPSVKMGHELLFSFTLNSVEQSLGKVRIEYGVDFMKKNGTLSRKLFKISEADFSGKAKSYRKTYSFRKISTRKYYAGAHGLAIVVNGFELANAAFELHE
jgi:3-methyladenine DNA glycosylase AlkC